VAGGEAPVAAERLGLGGQRPERLDVERVARDERLGEGIELVVGPLERERARPEPPRERVQHPRVLGGAVRLADEEEPGRLERLPRRLDHVVVERDASRR
jgi:hypothetical protein